MPARDASGTLNNRTYLSSNVLLSNVMMEDRVVKAGNWMRVSTMAQDEENQRPDNERWIAEHGYDLTKEYIIHGKSAYHGKQQKTLDAMFADMQAGVIEVLVVWKQDRIERRGMEAALNLVSRARMAGGRIEFVTQPHLNKLNDMGGRIAYVLTAEMAEDSSKTLSDRILVEQRKLRALGSFVGKPSYGHQIIAITDREGRAFKTLAPVHAEALVVARVFSDVASGIPVSRVGLALEAEGVRTRRGLPFSEKVLHDMIANPAYRGVIQYQGRAYMRVMPLVSATVWQAANASVKGRTQSRAHGKRVSAGRPEGTYAALLRPVCGSCNGAPMYRYTPEGHQEWATYRCAGLGPNGTTALRRGCGNTIKANDLDAEITEYFLENEDLEVTERFVPGTDYTEDIARIELTIRDLDFDSEDYDDHYALLRTELRRLKALPVAEPWISVSATGRTEGEAFAAMDFEERRAHLRLWTLTIASRDVEGQRWRLSGGPGHVEGREVPEPAKLLEALRA